MVDRTVGIETFVSIGHFCRNYKFQFDRADFSGESRMEFFKENLSASRSSELSRLEASSVTKTLSLDAVLIDIV